MPGRVFPATGGLIARHDGGYLLVHRDGRRSTITGAVCDAIDEALVRREPTPALTKLAAAHVVLDELVAWLATPSVPLTVLDAVRLDGFETIYVELVGRCNERCVHCYAESAPEITDALDRATVLSVIEQAVELWFRTLQLTGGDPLLSDVLVDAVAHARARGMANIEIYTNGLALTDELLSQLAPLRPSFSISLYGSDPAHHDAVTRTPGSHRRSLAAIDRVVAAGLQLRVSIVVVDQQVDVQATIDMLRARGVAEVGWTNTFAVGRGTSHADASQARPIVAETPAGGAHRSFASSSPRQGQLAVTYTGNLVPCIFQRTTSLGSVRDQPIAALLAAPSKRSLLRSLPSADDAARRLQCASCRLTEVGVALARSAS
jgi:MoaA/NifB/PqqE/SkfB family radical SAM enzyme